MQEVVFLFAEEWGWSKKDLMLLTGGEILDLIKKINRKRKLEIEAKKKAGPQCPLMIKPNKNRRKQ